MCLSKLAVRAAKGLTAQPRKAYITNQSVICLKVVRLAFGDKTLQAPELRR
jgi:hypothetical protein